MTDFSMNPNNNWLQYYEKKKPNGHLYDKFTTRSADLSAEYDKEMLKRTMLVHEATFCKQVYELHRLYKIQKDLMAQFQTEGFNGYSRVVNSFQPWSISSEVPSADAKIIWQIRPSTSGLDNKQPSLSFMKETDLQYSNGAPLRPYNNTSTKKPLDLQLSADAYADDDDLEILEEKPASILSRTNAPVLCGSFKLDIGNNEDFSCRGKSCADLQPQSNQCCSIVNDLNKPPEESTDTKITDFLGMGASTSHDQCYSSKGINSDVLGLEGNFKVKHVAEASCSSFFSANEEIKHRALFGNKEDDRNVNIVWFRHKPSGLDTLRGHYFAGSNTSRQSILASSASLAALKSPCEKKSRNMSYDEAIGSSVAQHGFFNDFSVDSTSVPNLLHSLKIPDKSHHRKHLQHNTCLRGANLSNVTPDSFQEGTAIQIVEHGCENSAVEVSWLRKKSVDSMKSEMALSCTNSHSQLMFSSRFCSEGTATRILDFPTSDNVEQSYQLSIQHIDTNTAPSAMNDTDMQMQVRHNKVDTNVRNLIDLNDSLPCTHDLEIDVCWSEGNIVSQEQMQVQHKKVDTNVKNLIDLNDALPCTDDLEIDVCRLDGSIFSQEPESVDGFFNDSLAATAAENLLAMSKDISQTAFPPQPGTLHWFAKLATLKENKMVNSSDNDHIDEFEVLTLQLEETKGSEYSSMPRTLEHKNEENHGCAASLLLTKPCRGKARKRRQKKDFQKDILPGLASLSRYEVSEDLRTLGMAPTKRGSRKRPQLGGRRQPRRVAVTAEVRVSIPPMPLQLPPAAASLEDERRSILGWGRTTRRGHRSRCPPANNASVRLS